MKQVVVMGGGNGVSLVVRGLKAYPKQVGLSAIVTMSDSGRSAITIREQWGLPGLADLLRAMLAMSKHDEQYAFLKDLLYKKRFTTHDKLHHINMGCALMGLTARHVDDLIPAIEGMQDIFECVGPVYPNTLEMTDLNVELSCGTIISGEANIDEPDQTYEGEIQRAWLDSSGALFDGAREAIMQADVLVTGPGDLYTSNIASLLAEGTKEAIAQSKAKIVYVAGNKYTVDGEPAPRTLSGRVAALDAHLPRPVDIVLYNAHQLTAPEEAYYAERNWGLIDFDVPALQGRRVIGFDIEKIGGGICAEKLGKLLVQHI